MKWIFIIMICTILLIVHACSIIVLVKSKQISKNQFVSFALYLSLSDAFMMGEYIWHTMINHHHDGSNTYLYLCYACETFDSWNGTIFTAASIIHMSGTTQRYNQNTK